MTIAEEPFARLNELLRGGIGEAAADQDRAHGIGDIAFELGLRDAGRLKILPVEIGDAVGPQGFERPATATREGRHAETCDPGENVGSKHRGVPGNRRAPIVADDKRLSFFQRGNKSDHVADIVEDAVGVDVRRR